VTLRIAPQPPPKIKSSRQSRGSEGRFRFSGYTLASGDRYLRIIVLLLLTFVIVKSIGFSAAVNNTEIEIASGVKIACQNSRGTPISTNINFNYFAYWCGQNNYKLEFKKRAPGEIRYIAIPALGNQLDLGAVSIRAK
jgi:hypothetical protein